MWVHPDMLKCVAFLGGRREGETGQPRIGGTAFFVSMLDTPGDPQRLYLVTARHCVDRIAATTGDGNLWVRMNTTSGCEWIATPLEEWRFHPTDRSVDVAAITWDAHADNMEYMPIAGYHGVATPQQFDELCVGPGDEVFVTGLFRLHAGSERNLPIVRTGNLAAMPHERYPSQIGPIEAYLAEVRSMAGLSGSPAWVHPVGARVKGDWQNGGSTSWTEEGGKVLWLGLVHGHFDEQNGVIDTHDDAAPSKMNVGLAAIVPATKVLEVLSQEVFVKDREQRAAKSRQVTIAHAELDH